MTSVVSTSPASNIASAAPSPQHALSPPNSSTITTSSLSGAVPAQLPVRSYATATKTATPSASAGASVPTQNAKPAVDSQITGAVAQGGSQSNNPNMANGADHGRKPSVVISASGASGYTPNGGPVAQNGRPAISFGSMGSQGTDSQPGAPFASQNPSLATPQRDARVITPTHSPSPIPKPAASGGRPPSGLQNANNSLNFGSMGPDNDMTRGGQVPQVALGQVPMHERRTSSQSDMSNASNMAGMNRPGFVPPNAGRGRQSFPQQGFTGSPGPNFRPLANQGRPNMAPQFQQAPPGSPYARDRATPQQTHAQPMPPMGGHPQMQYGGYPQHLGPHNPAQNMYSMQGFDPNSGYYPYYYPPQYGAQPTSQSPRPQFPNAFPGPPAAQMQPPYHPPGTPGMVRTPSQASERPPSSLGGPQTPMQHPPPPPSQTPTSAAQGAPTNANSFIRPKKSNAIKITDAQGNAVNFNKPSTTPTVQAQPGTPVIVSTPNAPTPPPRAPSSQHNRAESKSAKSSEETKNAFAEQVKRQLEEDKRKQLEEAAKVKPHADDSKTETEQRTEAEEAAGNQIKQAAVDAEKAAATAAGDSAGKADADAAAKALETEEDEKKRKEKEEEERIEREIAEMEAAEREEEERERAFQEKRAKEKEAAAGKEKERAAKADEELKRQEREAEEREAAREKEREKEKEKDTTVEPDDEAKRLFASLKPPTLGPGASAPESGRQTPASDHAGNDSSNEASSDAKPAQTRAAGGQKPKPAHLKLETSKPVERAEPTPGMQALKSARFLELKEELAYPDGFKSPNPALNQNAQRKGRAYDKDFLLQFQSIFKEKPSTDWDQKVKETLGPGDEPGSARPQSARTPSGQVPRQGSNRPQSGIQSFGGGPMGNFGGVPARTLPPGTTSEQRFRDSNPSGRPMGMTQMGRAPSGLGMNAPGISMSRTNSLQMMGGPNSPRQPSGRRQGGSKRDDRVKSVRQEAEMASKMPLTAHMEITPLERSTTGWKASSLGPAPAAASPDPSGNMAPDMVQRKVKAALNKMTPEKFDKISDQILDIAAQSKNESDGRTLRQVIQLTFEKACDEAHWAGMYAQFCHKMLTAMSPEIRDETIKDKNGNPVIGGALFRKYLLNRCQEEFERGWQANLPDKPEGDDQEIALLSDEYYVAAAAKRRGLGLIQFIGQLYKLRMLTLRIMHECVMRLLNFEGDPDEAAVENLTTLLKAVGASMEEEEQGKQLLATYFSRIEEVIIKNEKLPSRPKFMIMDLMDLRRAGWKGKNDSKGPKTIQQIHEEAEAAKAKEEAERQRTSNQRGPPGGGRMPQGRGDARNFSGGMPPPVDYQRTNVNMDDLRKLQGRVAQRQSGGGLGPGGSLGPSTLGARSGSRRGNLGPSSGNTTRTNTPPVDTKKEEPTQQNAFSALAALDPSGEVTNDHEAVSPPATRNGAKSPLPAAGDDAPTA